MLQVKPGRSGKQEQQQNSRNLGTAFMPSPVLKVHTLIPEDDATILLLVGAADGGGGEERRHDLLQRPGAPGEAGVLERAVEK